MEDEEEVEDEKLPGQEESGIKMMKMRFIHYYNIHLYNTISILYNVYIIAGSGKWWGSTKPCLLLCWQLNIIVDWQFV